MSACEFSMSPVRDGAYKRRVLKPDQFRQQTVYLFQRVLAAAGNIENLARYLGAGAVQASRFAETTLSI